MGENGIYVTIWWRERISNVLNMFTWYRKRFKIKDISVKNKESTVVKNTQVKDALKFTKTLFAVKIPFLDLKKIIKNDYFYKQTKI